MADMLPALTPLDAAANIDPNLLRPIFIGEVADPAAVANRIAFYAKDVVGVTQLFARDSGGTIYQLTPAGGAPVNAQYLTLALDGTLTAERVFNPTTGLTAADGGAGGNYTLTVNLSTGVAGGQTAIGGTAAADALTIQATSNIGGGPIYLQGVPGTTVLEVTALGQVVIGGGAPTAGESLRLNGDMDMGGSIIMNAGTVVEGDAGASGFPSYAFTGDLTTGLWYDPVGVQIVFDVAAADVAFLNTSGFSIAQQIQVAGSPTAFTVTGAAHTTLTLSTEAPDVNLDLARTVQFATGAIALQRAVRIQAPTYAFVGASTITTAATVYIDGAPAVGANATITNAYGLYVNAAAYINGKLTVTGSLDPTDITLSGGTAQFMQYGAGSTAAVSAGGTGRIRFNEGTNIFEQSLNGAAYVAFGGGGGGGTLDTAYDFGGAGAGRSIEVDSGAVRLWDSNTAAVTELLVLENSGANAAGSGAKVAFWANASDGFGGNTLVEYGNLIFDVMESGDAAYDARFSIQLARQGALHTVYEINETDPNGSVAFHKWSLGATERLRLDEDYGLSVVKLGILLESEYNACPWLSGAIAGCGYLWNKDDTPTRIRYTDDAGTDHTLAYTSELSPIGAQYLVLVADATLTAERVFTAGTGISVSDGGAGLAYTVYAKLSTGVAGGQAAIGGTAASENLTLRATSHATPGAVIFQSNGTPTEIGRISGVGLVVTQTIQTTGSPTAFTVTGAAHTTLTLSTEAPDVNINLNRTVQFATGAIALQRAVRIQAPTYAFVGASTITTAATVYIDGAPAVGANATITNAYGLYVNAAAYINGKLTVTGSIDPTDITLSGGTAQFMQYGAGSTAAVSAGGTGRIRFNEGTNIFEQSLNGAAYVAFGGGGGAPVNAQYLCLAVDATLTVERVFTPSTGLTAVDSGAGLAYTLTVDLSTGKAGGLTAIGGTAASENLTLRATTNATPGAIIFQSSGTPTEIGRISGVGLVVTQTIQVTGSPTAFTVTGAAHTTLTLSTEAPDVDFNMARTVQFATGALATQRTVVIRAATYRFVGASTITNAATLAITGAPVAGTNATLTNSYALWIQSGTTNLDGIFAMGAVTVLDTARDFNVNIRPYQDDTLDIGTAGRRWRSIWATDPHFNDVNLHSPDGKEHLRLYELAGGGIGVLDEVRGKRYRLQMVEEN